MQKYKEVPWWWYSILLLLAFFAGNRPISLNYVYHLTLDVRLSIDRSYRRSERIYHATGIRLRYCEFLTPVLLLEPYLY